MEVLFGDGLCRTPCRAQVLSFIKLKTYANMKVRDFTKNLPKDFKIEMLSKNHLHKFKQKVSKD